MPPKPLILAFDTSAAHVAAALLSGDQIIAQHFEERGKGQDQVLFPILENLLDQAGVAWSDMTALGVGVGPGNFTGIRISVSAARGLALSLGIPAVGVSMFDVLGYGQTCAVYASVKAPRDQMYLHMGQGHAPQLVDFDANGLPADATDALTVIGFRADDIAAACGGRTAAHALPLAESIARIAATRYTTSTQRPTPLYIKPADAAPSKVQPPKISA